MKNKRVTIKDVAKEAGVSIGVVSFVLNNTVGQTIPEITRNRVVEAVRKLSYTPNAIARGMRTKKSMAIGIVSFWDINEQVFVEVLDGIYKVADQNDFTIVICNLHSKKRKFGYVDLFNGQLVDGVIFIAPNEARDDYNESEHINIIKENNIPSVIIHGSTVDADLSYIDVDYYNTTFMAVEYLVKLGHKKVGYILPKMHEPKCVRDERRRGFLEALHRFGIGDFVYSVSDFDKLVQGIKDGSAPTGIVAYKSDYAHSLFNIFIRNQIKVPEQISVIAANNATFVEYLYPPLTTVQIPFNEMGQKACETLIKKFEDKSFVIKISVPNKLCIRDSCSRAE